MKKIITIALILVSFSTANAQISWDGGGGDNLWATAANWSGDVVPTATDEVQFNSGATLSVSIGSTAISAGQLKISNGTKLTLTASNATGATALTIAGLASGDDLTVDAGTELNASSTNTVSGATFTSVQINLATGATGSISGNMTFGNTSGTVATAHRLQALSANAITFQNGAVFTSGLGFSGNAFGAGASPSSPGSVNFASGSTYVIIAGSNPFGGTGASTVVTFQNGSTYRHSATSSPALSGRTYANIEWNANVSTALTGASALTVNGNFIIKSVGRCTLNLNATPASIIVKGNILVESGGVLLVGTSALSSGTATLSMAGTAEQTITNNGTFVLDTKSNLLMNNANNVALGSDLSILKVSFTSGAGKLKLGNYNLRLTATAATAVTGADDTKFIVTDGTGSLILNCVGAAAAIFNVAPNTTDANSTQVKLYASTTDSFYVRVTEGSSAYINAADGINKTWHIAPKNGGNSGTSMIFYVKNSHIGANIGAADLVSLAHYNSGAWNAIPTTTAFLTSDVGTFDKMTTETIVTSFSPYTVGKTGATLPIELTSFVGKAQGTRNVFDWATASEKNTAYFRLERSANGVNDWHTIASAKAAGNSNATQSYTAADNTPLSIGFYRLVSVDNDGSTQTSKTLSIVRKNGNLTIKAFPVPTSDNVNVDIDAATDVTIVLQNTLGQVVLTQVSKGAGARTEVLNLQHLPKGVYTATVNSNTEKMTMRVVKQ